MHESQGGELTAEQLIQESEALQGTARSAAALAPYTPSQEERDQREIPRWPYRAWCKLCVLIRGKNSDHARMDAELSYDLDAISIDFMYLSQNDESPFLVLAFRVHSTRWTEAYTCVSKSARDSYNVFGISALH